MQTHSAGEDTQRYSVPAHYLPVARELRRLIRDLHLVFVHRPVPDGHPVADPGLFVSHYCRRVRRAMDELDPALKSLFDTPAAGAEPAAAAAQAVAWLRDVAEELAAAFHSVWQQPFPAHLADGQPLVSAFAESALRELLRVLETTVVVVANPERAVATYGSAQIALTLELKGRREKAALDLWMARVLARHAPRPSSWPRTVCSTPQRECGGSGWKLLAAFVFGAWWGKRD